MAAPLENNPVQFPAQAIEAPNEPARQVDGQVAVVERQNARVQGQAAVNLIHFAEILPNQNAAVPAQRAVQAMNAPELVGIALRRRLRGELVAFFDLMNQTPIRDEMTARISLWAREFRNALVLDDTDEEIFNAFVPLLQELLREPIYDTPFDDEAILGSDGVAYGKKAYVIWKDRIDAQFRGRAPMNLDQDAVFTHEPHPIVRHAVRWLRGHNRLHEEQWINDAWAEIQNRPRAERIRRIREGVQQRRAEELAQRQEQARIWQQEDAGAREQILAPINLLQRGVDDLIDQAAQRIRQLEIAPAPGAPLNNIQQDIQDLHTAIDVLEREEDAIDRRITVLAGNQGNLRQDITTCSAESDELQLKVNQVKKAINKQKKKRLLGVITAVVVVAASIAATYFFPPYGGIAVGALAGGGQFTVMGSSKF